MLTYTKKPPRFAKKNLEDNLMNFKDFYPFPAEVHHDVIPGGVADNDVPTPLDAEQLALGLKVELEHTNDPKVALEIALDHIRETPDYYSKLAMTGLSPEIAPDPSMAAKSTPPMAANAGVEPTAPACCQHKPVMEDKSTTTYEQYQDIARRLIAQLMKMAQVDRKNFSNAQKQITPSVVKSVLIGLGDSDPKLSAELTKLGAVAYKPKIVKPKL